MINTKALREKILDLAMRGKLVEQVASDESAREFLEKMQTEKEQLIKEKKIKKEKPLPEISEEEIPFGIPESWEWVRIGEIQLVKGGKRVPKGKQLVDFPDEKVYIRVADMKNSTVELKNLKYATKDVYEVIKNYTIDSADLYLTIAGTIGRVGTIPTALSGSLLTENAVKLVNIFNLESKFILFTLQSKVIQEQFDKLFSQVAQPKLSIRSINQTIFPLPPLQEQKRIVSKIEELFALIDIIETSLTEYNQLAGQLDKKVLDLAMRGKLVEQDPSDEPASELLKKIQAEKELLLKEKKIKKEKTLPEIREEEFPFDIPENWKWVRLGSVVYLLSGRDLTKSEYSDIAKGIPYITGASNFHEGSIKSVRWTEYPKVEAHRNDILLTVKGTIGDIAVLNSEKVHIARQIVAIRNVTRMMEDKYLYWFIFNYVEHLQKASKGVIPGISREDILGAKIPIPPLKEQKQIVSKIEEIRAELLR
ncbi:restriction endonuclease subunit S [Enterococcus mundtii]|uniref:Type I restriction modification DNA specificity domain-containing protein n=1 Tax=Enterococcus mundtii TaxID=53346 RepID=A0A2S7RZE8_ENTMU|nr:restriction endonuclease subunit S [Enterococcus mundtii]PQF25594.1 hypothetical protein CUS89_01020 [Enterococcus mundtii]